MSFWTMPLPGLMRKKAGGLNVADVFSVDLYTGDGSGKTITNGLDMRGGGLIWNKCRSNDQNNQLFSGPTFSTLTRSNLTDAASSASSITGLATGYSFNTDWDLSQSGRTFVNWAFVQAPKFFDIVTYAGNGSAGRQIAHGLGVAPGFITTKSLSATGDWNSYHRSASGDLILNSTAAQAGSRSIITAADATTFTVSGAANTNGVTYVAYLFAHDPSPKGIIQCGSFTPSSGAFNVNLGWRPQYILWKCLVGARNWEIVDAARGLPSSSGVDAVGLVPNVSNQEYSGRMVQTSLAGFANSGTSWFVNEPYIYMAIRAEGV